MLDETTPNSLSPADAEYIARHRRAGQKTLEHAARLHAEADRLISVGEWELGAQAEEHARDYEGQAQDEFDRIGARIERSEAEQSIFVDGPA